MPLSRMITLSFMLLVTGTIHVHDTNNNVVSAFVFAPPTSTSSTCTFTCKASRPRRKPAEFRTITDTALSSSVTNDYDGDDDDWLHTRTPDAARVVGDWEFLHGNFILRPSNVNINDNNNGSDADSDNTTPRALIHFLGGALVGKAPHISYRYILERLAQEGYLIVATPYDLSFDYLSTCDNVITNFERVAANLARQYGGLPVVGMGHSCGSLLQVLITSLFPDTPRAVNALLSFNNKPVTEAVPVFEQVVAPFFTYVAGRSSTSSSTASTTSTTTTASSSNDNLWRVGPASGSDVLRVGLDLAKAAALGKVPSDHVLNNAFQVVSPFATLQSPAATGGNDDANNSHDASFQIPSAVRQALESAAGPPSQALSQAGLLPLMMELLETLEQIPRLIDEVADGARDFDPPPAAVRAAAQRSYRARRTLLVRYTDDPLDETALLEELLQVAGQVVRMKRPMMSLPPQVSALQRANVPGGHAAPLLAPPLDLAQRAEELLGEEAAREQLQYAQAEQTVREVVQFLDESDL